MMDFDKKDELMQKIAMQGTMAQELQSWQQIAIGLAAEKDPALANQLMAQATGQPAPQGKMMSEEDREKIDLDRDENRESKQVQNARERANTAAQPGGSTA